MDAAVVLGDYLYIDGGEFSQLVDGVPGPGQQSVGSYTPYSRQSKQS
jgi:hypothetical protein